MNLDPFISQRPIDVTAFIGQWPWRLRSSATAAGLDEYATRAGLSALWVSHLASVFGYDTRSGNEALLDACADDDRLWPFPIVNPSEDGWAHELEWAHREGARGVRIVPGYQGYRLDHPETETLLAAVAERDLPLHVCVTLEDHRTRHPRYDARPVDAAQIVRLLRRTTRHRVVLSGMRPYDWAEIEAQLEPYHYGSHVLVDLWFANGPAGVLTALSATGRAGRFAFGSCAPVQAAEATIVQLATADISDDDRYALCRGNVERLLQ